MFGLGLLVAFALLVSYVGWRASSAAWLAARTTRRQWLVGGALLCALFAVGRLLPRDLRGAAGGAAGLVTLDLLVMLFLMATALLVVELVTAGGWLLRRQAAQLRLAALGAGAAMTLVAVVQGRRAPAVTEHAVVLPELPPELDGTRIVALSDLHIGRQLDEPWLAARVAEVSALEPDLIVLLGDIVEGREPDAGQRLAPLAGLEAPLGVWAVLGNHDRSRTRASEQEARRGDPDGSAPPVGTAVGIGRPADRWLTRWGIGVLHDQSVLLAPGLVLAGVDDLTARRRSGGDEGATARALASRPPGATLLLSHTPWQVEQASQAGAGLMLSGHTHGGQIWPFGLLTRIAYPYLAGRFEVGPMTLIVSRGTGSWGPRMRLWHRGEILQVTLRAPRPTDARAGGLLDAVTTPP